MSNKAIEIIFITGKGGVGKTELACRLAMFAASISRKTLIVEMNGTTSLNHRFNIRQNYTIQCIQPNLFSLSITPEESIKEYALKQLKFKRLYNLIFENRYVKPLVHGAPGLYDAVQLGKIYDLHAHGEYDLIIVDAPATGHCLTMLESAKTMMELTRIGPMYDSNQLVENLIGDNSKTAILLTTTLEELPTRETMDLYERLSTQRRSQVIGCVANKYKQAPITVDEWARKHERIPLDMGPWVKQASWLLNKVSQESAHLQEIRANLKIPIQTMPLLNDDQPFDMEPIWNLIARSR